MGKTSVSTRALVEHEVNNSATYTPTPNDNQDADIFFRQGSDVTTDNALGEFLGKRTALERMLMVVIILIMFIMAILIIAFTCSTARPLQSEQGSKLGELCLSETCVRVAGEILSKMNKSVDPCTDFYTYSCGKWLTETIPPDNYGSWNAFQELNEMLTLKTKRILDTWGKAMPDSSAKSDPTKKANGGSKEKSSNGRKLLDSQEKTYTFYKSCGGDARETLGPQPMLEILEYTGGSTVFEDNSKIANIDFKETDKRITKKFGGSFFYDMAVYPKNSNTTNNILTIGPRTDLSLGPYSTYKNISEADPRMKAFKYAMQEAFYLLTDSFPDITLTDQLKSRIANKIQQIIDLEVAFSQLITDQDKIQMMPTEDTYLITNLTRLKQIVPQVDWDGILSNLFQGVGIEITDSEPIQLLDPEFFMKVGPFLQNTSREALQNYQYWRVIDISMSSINHDFEIIKANLTLVVKGSNSGMRPRWEQCVNLINAHSIVGNVIGAAFIRDYFNPGSKQKVRDMIKSIRESFVTSLDGLGWLDPATRAYAVKKAQAMHDFLAYPDQLLNDTYVGELLSGVSFHEDTYYENQLQLGYFSSKQDLLKLRKPVDKAEWEMTPQQINAYYVPAKNSFTFPAGILQKPFYSEEYPMSFNYGGIGVVVGHELTHGFDTQGRTYDLEGNQREWFKKETAQKFTDLSQCFVNQYSEYEVYGMHVDGVLTLGENIADNGGIKNSYQAYKEYERIHGKELIYPGLGLTHDQVFFVAFGQIWCNIQTEESARFRIESDSHAPEQIRVPGAVSNLQEFADAFNCKAKTPMNPQKKCAVW
ncbi:endothelin-converting enzyme homolog isoform X2 [Convolutriloba macropyga]|uniref:endothelin-converting enzyme homolog isoform X2 n=1 Tax=Convolutriloba macropyga TaxID=536237 RepID=UPI003F525F7D